jgi:hypothetical protein
MKLFILLLTFLALSTATSNSTNKIWPKPANFTYTPEGDNYTVSPCDLKYVV